MSGLVVAFSTIMTVLAVLAMIGLAAAFLAVVMALLSWRSLRVRAWWGRFRRGFSTFSLALAWVTATVAMLGSLYLSDVMNFTPCRLCWYQRIAMYPLVLLLGIAVVRNDLYTAKRYLIPLAAVGALLSTYHYQLERFPQQPALSCGLEVLCNVAIANVWGFVSVPFMALAAFVLIVTVLAVAKDGDSEFIEAATD